VLLERQAAAGRLACGAGRARVACGWAGRTGAALRSAGRCCGGRCCAPTTLRCSPRGRAAKLAARAALAPLRHVATSQKNEARFARRPRGCAARRRRNRPAERSAAPVRPAQPHAARARPAPQANRPAAACRSSNTGGARSQRRDARHANHDAACIGAGRLPRARSCAAEKRSSTGPRAQRASSSDSPRLSERSARSAVVHETTAGERCCHAVR